MFTISAVLTSSFHVMEVEEKIVLQWGGGQLSAVVPKLRCGSQGSHGDQPGELKNSHEKPAPNIYIIGL